MAVRTGAADHRAPVGLLPDQWTMQPGRAIEVAKISVGDRIAGGDGCWQQVQQVCAREFTGEVVRIKALGLLPIRVLPHQVLLTFIPATGEVEWKEAKELDEAGWLALPRMRQTKADAVWASHEFALPDAGRSPELRIDLADPDTAWFTGRYLADGSSTLYNEDRQQRGLASMYIGERKQADIARVMEIARSKFNRANPFVLHRGGEARIDFGRTVVARLFRDRCGLDSASKHLPPEAWALSDEALKAMVGGWMAGDACSSEGSMAGRTISPSLALGLQLACARLGALCSLRRQDRGEVSFGGRQITVQPIFDLSIAASVMQRMFGWSSSTGGSALKHRVDDQFIFVPIRSIARAPYTGSVLDVRTERRTCVISGAVVATCDGKTSLPGLPRRHPNKRQEVAV